MSDTVPTASRRIGAWCLCTGLFQGVLLYLMSHAADARAWPATVPLLFPPLFLVTLCLPVLAIAGLGHLDRRRLTWWLALAALALVGVGCWEGWRAADLPLAPLPAPGHADTMDRTIYRSAYPGVELVFLIATGLFVAHALIVAAARDGRRVAIYTTYFDTAWTLGVRLGFSLLFMGVTWLVLTLGAELFELVKLRFLTELMRKDWFWIPVLAFAFACAMHLTDMRPAIVHGIRTLLLTLMSWLLPVTVVLVGGFLLTLPFTGLDPLWKTRSAASVLLCASAVLVVLVNAAWQGGGTAAVAAPVRLSARAAVLLLAPLVAIAVYALALRVREHGWTSDRVHAAACLLVAACYAAGYLAAGLRPGWLPLLAKVNIATAFVVPAVILALASPLADPARIAVASQVGRLAAGRVDAAHFDYVFLRFESARFGRAALAELDRTASGPQAAVLHRQVAAVRRMSGRWDDAKLAPPADFAVTMRVHPDGARLPESFVRADWTRKADWQDPPCLRNGDERCDAFVLDVDGDGREEVVLLTEKRRVGAVFAADAQGTWTRLATLDVSALQCSQFQQALAAGKVAVVTPRLNDLEIGGVRVRLAAEKQHEPCPPAAK